MKRSVTVSLGILALLTAGCGQDEGADDHDKDVRRTYTSVEDCQQDESDNSLTDAECRAYFKDAQDDLDKSAPRFPTSDYCQSFSGDKCHEITENGTSLWVPALAGFALGTSAGLLASVPLYRGKDADCQSGKLPPGDPKCSTSGSNYYSHGSYVGSSYGHSSFIYIPSTSPISSQYSGANRFSSAVRSSAPPVSATASGRPTSGVSSSGAARSATSASAGRGFGSGSARGGLGASAAGHGGGGE